MFTFIESTPFERVREVYLDDEEYRELQEYFYAKARYGSDDAAPRIEGGVRA